MFLRILIIIIVCTIQGTNVTIAQTLGCTDAQANNFNPGASRNDGSCKYNTTSYSPIKLIDKLSDTLNETSGLLNLDGELWSMCDSGNPNALYHFDKNTGAILQTIVIRNASNRDWEDLAADNNNIYIGDFGNNEGNRTNLVVYKIARSQISTKKVDSVTAKMIYFSYKDQTDFTIRHNAHRYDCESMMAWNDTLHLFSKDWVEGHSRHFILSTSPGTYSLSPVDSIDAGCQISGASVNPKSGRVVLIGYNKTGFCYLWMLWDFNGTNLFGGNKRKVDLGFFLNTGQIEGICFNDSNSIYITNENNFVTNKLYIANVGQWMNKKANVGLDKSLVNISKLKLYPNPASNEINLSFTLQKPAAVSYCIYSMDSKLVYCSRFKYGAGNTEQKINISSLVNGIYYMLVHTEKSQTEKILFVKQ